MAAVLVIMLQEIRLPLATVPRLHAPTVFALDWRWFLYHVTKPKKCITLLKVEAKITMRYSPSVTCCDGSECFRGGSLHGDSKYGFTGDSMSRLSRGVDFLLTAGTSASSSLFDSSTTILKPSWLNEGVNDDLRSRLKCSLNKEKQEQHRCD